MFKNKKVLKITAFIAILAILTTAVAIVIFSANAKWTLSKGTRIYWSQSLDSIAEHAELEAQIRLFSAELAEKTGSSLPIYYGSNAGGEDILLSYDATLPAQGYRLEISGTQLGISASDADGLFYGCRYVIKQLAANEAVTEVTSSPAVLERALSLDNGRKYFSVDWIKQMIRELSWSEMNTLVLHFSEEMGWGIESKLYPWLAGRDGSLCTQADISDEQDKDELSHVLTQEEIAEIVEYAKLYHIDIIPSIDSPGHMNYLVKRFNEQCAYNGFSFTFGGKTCDVPKGSNIGNYYSYNGITTAVVPGSRNADYSRGIDISNDTAVAFVKSLLEEYGTLFHSLGCTEFDIGGDELLGWGAVINNSVSRWMQLDHWKAYAVAKENNNPNAVAYDAFLLYMNDLAAFMRGLGYTSVRMWNDDALRSSDTGWTGVVKLDTSIDIWYWDSSKNSVSTYTNAGHNVYNILSDYNYYAMTDDYFSDSRNNFKYAYPDKIYESWTPFMFGSGGSAWANVAGSAFGIWCDNPTLRTAEEVMADVLPILRSHGAKAWDTDCNESMSYSSFTTYWSKIGNCPNADVTSAPEAVDLSELEAAIAAFNTSERELYTTSSFEAYEKAVEDGKAIASSSKATSSEVKAATEAISKAFGALKLSSASASFKTTRVHSGGTAVLKISAPEKPESITLIGPDGAVTDFEIVTVSGGSDTECYIKFKVTGIGKQSYEVTINGEFHASAELKLWK